MSSGGGDLGAFGIIIWWIFKYPIAVLFFIASYIFPSFSIFYSVVFFVLTVMPLEEWLPDWFWDLFMGLIIFGIPIGAYILFASLGVFDNL